MVVQYISGFRETEGTKAEERLIFHQRGNVRIFQDSNTEAAPGPQLV